MAWGSDNDKNKKSPLIVERSEVSKAVEKSYKKYANGFQRPSVLLNLEPRMMFDGAAPAVVDDIIDTTESSTDESLPNPEADSEEESLNGDDDEESESSSLNENSPTSEDPDSSTSENSLFDQLTNNSSDLTVDPASGLDSAEDELLDNLESTLDDLEISVDQEPVVALNTETNSTVATEELVEQESFDYTDNTDIDRVVFFDTTVEGYEDLLEGLVNDLQNPEAETLTAEHITSVDVDALIDVAAENDNTLFVNGVAIHLLQGEEGQIEQITESLTSYSDLSAIDIISHGATGEIQLGNQRLNNESLDTYGDLVAQWGDALAENGDILLYGCDVAGHGQDFLDNIAELTDADIAGSDDLTGNTEFGGDFDLEAEVGRLKLEPY